MQMLTNKATNKGSLAKKRILAYGDQHFVSRKKKKMGRKELVFETKKPIARCVL
jgi:uncharacterized protein YcbX